MAILGGGVGGAGNPVGGTFTGPSESLEVIGNHVYLLGGAIGATSSLQTYAEFTSGNFYTVGILQMNGYVNPTTDNLASGKIGVLQVSFNDQVVLILKTDTKASDISDFNACPLLIPPYTEVLMQVITDGNDAASLATISYVAERYRTRV